MMMTYEDAIKYRESLDVLWEAYYDEDTKFTNSFNFRTALENVTECVERQIPQKPLHFEQPLVVDEEIVSVWEYDCCPVCGVEVREEYDNFCNNCGKALNWGERR